MFFYVRYAFFVFLSSDNHFSNPFLVQKTKESLQPGWCQYWASQRCSQTDKLKLLYYSSFLTISPFTGFLLNSGLCTKPREIIKRMMKTFIGWSKRCNLSSSFVSHSCEQLDPTTPQTTFTFTLHA